MQLCRPWTRCSCREPHPQQPWQLSAQSTAALAQRAAAFGPAELSAPPDCTLLAKAALGLGIPPIFEEPCPCTPGRVSRGQPFDSKDFLTLYGASIYCCTAAACSLHRRRVAKKKWLLIDSPLGSSRGK